MEFISKIGDYLTNCQFWTGVIAAAAVIIVVEFLLWAIMKMRRKVDIIVIKDEGGDFAISRKAFKEFLKGVIATLPGIVLKDVALRRRPQNKVHVTLFIAVQANANLVTAHDQLRNSLLTEAQSKLGVNDVIDGVDIICANLPTSADLKANAVSPQKSPDVQAVGYIPVSSEEEAPTTSQEAD